MHSLVCHSFCTPFEITQPNSSNTNNNNTNSDFSKKEEYRRYLEKTGVMDALTKVLVGLYEEPDRPPNALEYIKRYLGAPSGVDVDALKRENDDLKKQIEKLKQQQQQQQQPKQSGQADK